MNILCCSLKLKKISFRRFQAVIQKKQLKINDMISQRIKEHANLKQAGNQTKSKAKRE